MAKYYIIHAIGTEIGKSVEQSLKTRPSVYYMLALDKIDISI